MNSTSIGRSTDGGRCLHRRHAAEAEPLDRDALRRAERVDTLVADVERQQAATACVDGQAEPRRARLLGVDADARRCGALQLERVVP